MVAPEGRPTEYSTNYSIGFEVGQTSHASWLCVVRLAFRLVESSSCCFARRIELLMRSRVIGSMMKLVS